MNGSRIRAEGDTRQIYQTAHGLTVTHSRTHTFTPYPADRHTHTYAHTIPQTETHSHTYLQTHSPGQTSYQTHTIKEQRTPTLIQPAIGRPMDLIFGGEDIIKLRTA